MKRIFVALSGGVDSAVAAHILKEEGWDVTGVFIRVWQPDFLPCSQDEEERAALRVAAHLGIAFKKLDLSDVYKKEVVDEMVSEYKKGRTPNPDVLCNASVKFGAFLKYSQEQGADKIATGHHAQVIEKEGVFSLVRGVDPDKDQAYFLWKLSTQELQHTLMPIGKMQKEDVRSYAKKHSLPSASKPDSQGLCFIGHVDMKTFLKNFIQTKTGVVLNKKGETIGTHEGSELITIGQRGGFTVTSKNTHRDAQYVVSKNIETNTITVATQKESGEQLSSSISLTETNWIHNLSSQASYTCEIRYHGQALPCSVVLEKRGALIQLKTPILVAGGQSVVVYDRDVCLGGGIVV